MIEWYWLLAVGVAAAGIGYFFGGRIVRRAAESELTGAAAELEALRSRSMSDTEKAKALAHEVETLAVRAERAEQEARSLAPQVASLTSTISDLKQTAADANTARRAAEAALSAKQAEQARAVEQAAASRKAATESAEKYDAITGEFVSLKRSLREALDAMARTERERDGAVAEATLAKAEAEAKSAEAQQARDAAVAQANAERDEAVAAAAAASQRRADAATLRKEIMNAQRELADLRDELARKDRVIRQMEGETERSKPLVSPVVEAFSGFDPEAGAAVSDAEMDSAIDASLPTAIDAANGDDVESVADGSDEGDDDIFTVDDLPGGDWEPDDADRSDSVDPESALPDPVVETLSVGADHPEPDVSEQHQPGIVADPTGTAGEMTGANADDEPIVPPVPADAGPAVPDNLRLVKGIGPKFEALLHARNITTYEEIAALTDDAEWETYLDTFAGRIEREEWREQAAALIRDRNA